MANTYSQINIHVVFAVRGRDNILHEKFRHLLFDYISGIFGNLGQYSLAVGGYKNHVHVFFEQNPDILLSRLLGKLKPIHPNGLTKTNLYQGISNGKKVIVHLVIREDNAMM